jgi:hypothetical protein
LSKQHQVVGIEGENEKALVMDGESMDEGLDEWMIKHL